MNPHHHFIQWLISNANEPFARFTCTAPVGAQCRSWCAVGCEEVCTAQPKTVPGPDGTTLVVGHPWEDSGECRIKTWLDNGGLPGELYYGEEEPLRGPEPQPIETEWDGDCYLWQYAEPAGVLS